MYIDEDINDTSIKKKPPRKGAKLLEESIYFLIDYIIQLLKFDE